MPVGDINTLCVGTNAEANAPRADIAHDRRKEGFAASQCGEAAAARHKRAQTLRLEV